MTNVSAQTSSSSSPQVVPAFSSLRFTGIQALRGIAALFVILAHIRFVGRGAFGVDLFFCISGFIAMLTSEKKADDFLKKRLIRILPFYYLMTLFTFVLLLAAPSLFEQTTVSLPGLLKSLLLIPFDLGGNVLLPLFRIGWTLQLEIFFYLLFVLAMRRCHRHRGTVCCLLLVSCILAGAVVTGGATLTGAVTLSGLSLLGEEGYISSYLAPVLFYGSPLLLEFALGILSYQLLHFLYQRLSRYACPGPCPLRSLPHSHFYGLSLLLTGVATLAFLFLYASSLDISGIRRLLFWGLPALLCFLCFASAGLLLDMPKPLVWLGDISFSLYLIHYYPLQYLDRRVFDFSCLSARSLLGVLLCLLLILLLSQLCYQLIELRFTSWLRKRLR